MERISENSPQRSIGENDGEFEKKNRNKLWMYTYIKPGWWIRFSGTSEHQFSTLRAYPSLPNPSIIWNVCPCKPLTNICVALTVYLSMDPHIYIYMYMDGWMAATI